MLGCGIAFIITFLPSDCKVLVVFPWELSSNSLTKGEKLDERDETGFDLMHLVN